MSTRRIRRFALACLCLAPLATRADAADHAAAAQADRLRAAVDRAVQPLMAQYGVPGMAVAVTRHGQAWFFNYGLASTADRAPVSEHTLFELGSVSKTFTATLACQALGQGKLSFGDHPSRYLPALKGSAIDAATLLELATYSAGGLPQQVPDEVTNDAQMIDWLRAFAPQAAPGTARRYSNVSIGLFGRITALGLRHTYIHVPGNAMADYAWGYDKTDAAVRVKPDVFDAETYGVKSSAADMIRYVQANIDRRGLDPAMQRALACTHTGFYRVGDMVQGPGWEQVQGPFTLARLLAANSAQMINESNPATRLAPPQAAPAGTLFDKTGSTRGFGAYVAFAPSQGIGIVMLANKNVPIPARVEAGYAILAALAPGGH